MAKNDGKDDRIAELELAVEAATKEATELRAKAEESTALRAELDKANAELASARKSVRQLQDELAAKNAAKSDISAVSGLDPAKAVQLKASRLIIDAVSKARVNATAGSVLAEASAAQELRKKHGTGVQIHAVSKEELEAAKKANQTL